MAEAQTVKDLDTVKLISYLLRRTYGQQTAESPLIFQKSHS